MWPFNKKSDLDLETRAPFSNAFSDTFEKRTPPTTDVVISTLISTAAGRIDRPLPTATAALESCAGLVGRAFAAAEVEGLSISPSVMNLIGRSLIRRGEAVFRIMIMNGEIRLFPAATYNIVGDFQPENWTYELHLAGPSEQKSVQRLPASSVLHFMYSFSPNQPWCGLSPLDNAHLAGRLSAETVAALGDELSGPRGSVLAIPTDGKDKTIDLLRADIRSLRGRLAFVESLNNGWEGGGATATQHDWQAKRVGASPPDVLAKLLALATEEIQAACGISGALFKADSSGTGAREAYRQFLFGVVQPLGKIVEYELSEKLEREIKLDWSELRAADITGRARAFGSLVKSGMTLDKAAAVTGILSDG